jgi:ATP-binding cassette subfamily F protein uup
MDLLIPPPPSLGNNAIQWTNAGAKVGDAGRERWLFRGLTISLKPGQCTGVIGRNGVGKTTLLRICLGERQPDEGTVKIGKRVIFNYIDQARMQLEGTGTVLDEISAGSETVLFGDQQLSARSYLRRFLFSDERVKEPVAQLSGGERARLMLAKVLRRGGNVLVLDEPTNDLDLASLRMLEEALADFDGTVLVVSHDRYFLDRICDQIIAFEDAGLFVQPGNYSYYLEKKQQRDALRPATWISPPAPAAKSESVRPPAPERPRKLTFKEQRELEGMEAAILASETRVHELETTLNDPEFHAARSREANGLIAELEAARAEVTRLYSRWEELAARSSEGKAGSA